MLGFGFGGDRKGGGRGGDDDEFFGGGGRFRGVSALSPATYQGS
jgi:hypothetical protein